MIYSPLQHEPRLVEIMPIYITTEDPDPDISWIKGELIFRIPCEDGVFLLYHVPGKCQKDFDGDELLRD